mgnify:CR=1 FL=1
MSFDILLIDDSALSRRIVKDIAEELPGVRVVGEAVNGREGIQLMEQLRPDLVILDVEMPVMDGISVLKERKARQIKSPVLMLSVLTREGADTTFQALELGALDFVPKPSAHMGFMVDELQALLREKISDLISAKDSYIPTVVQTGKIAPGRRITDFDLVLIGSSTGGPQCLHRIFRKLPANFQLPICVVQHMPPVFTAAFASRLSSISGLQVFEAADGIELKPGQAVVAKGGLHLGFQKPNHQLIITLNDGPRLNAHRPSIDFSVRSAQKIFKNRILGIIMTGMGRDGVDGLKELRRAGGFVIAQDEKTSTVFGMNRRAIEEGASDVILSDEAIADYLLELK